MDIPLNAGKLTDEIKEAFDYWTEYRGEEIRIEYTQLEADADNPKTPVKITHGVEGTVSNVMSLPPGFVLTDAVEFVNTEQQTLDDVPPGSAHTEDKGEIFIAFDAIDTIVFDNEN